MTTLSAQVRATNQNHENMNALIPLVIAWLKPFDGKKISTAQSELVAVAKKTRPIFERPGFRWYLSLSYTSVYLKCDTNVQCGEHSCVYSKGGDIYLGSNNEVFSLQNSEFPPFKTDFSEETIYAARKKIEELKAQISEIQSENQLYMFEGAY